MVNIKQAFPDLTKEFILIFYIQNGFFKSITKMKKIVAFLQKKNAFTNNEQITIATLEEPPLFGNIMLYLMLALLQ